MDAYFNVVEMKIVMFIEGRGVTFLIWAFEPAIGNFTWELLGTLVKKN